MAQVRNPWLLRALVAAVTQLGGTIRTQCEVTGWQRDGDRVVAAETNQGLVPAGEYLVCGGAWSERLLGPGAAVFPVRGQIVAYRIPEGGPAHIHVWDKQYLVPRGDGLVLAGSTEELVGFDASTTDDGIRGLREFAESHWPALRGATVEATWAGLRPGSRDNRPTLGRVPGYRNVSVATGHFRAGVQLSPATGRLMAELLTGREPFIPLDSFRPDRPAGPPARPAFRS
jgi:glycine oxidase